MYPVPSEASADVNLDLTHLDLLKLESSPDILILPSNLGKFAKVRPVPPLLIHFWLLQADRAPRPSPCFF
jgi:hypothetical protein